MASLFNRFGGIARDALDGFAIAARIQPMGLIPMMIGGFLVGYGRRVGSGCTSSHGICGISRLSKRSIAATFSFMAAAVITVFVVRHLLEGAPLHR